MQDDGEIPVNVIKPRKAPREPEAALIAVKKKPGPTATAAGSGASSNNNNNNSSSGASSPKAPNLKKNRDANAIRHDFLVLTENVLLVHSRFGVIYSCSDLLLLSYSALALLGSFSSS